MNETYRFKAIVLGRQPIHEHDLSVDLLSEEYGRIKLVARGAKKFRSKVAAHVEPFCLVEAMAIRGRREDYLGSALSGEVFSVIKNDLGRLKYASEAVLQIKESVKEKEPVPEVFKALVEYLTFLNSEEFEPTEFQANLFIVKIQSILGGLDITAVSLTVSENCINLIKATGSSFYSLLAKKVSQRAKVALELKKIANQLKIE